MTSQAMTILDDLAGRFDVASLVDRAGAALGAARTCAGDRPRACWRPAELPPIRSTVGRGGTVRVCFRVRNTGLATRDVFVAATGPDAALAVGHPSIRRVDALQTGELVAEVRMPERSDRAELTLWVRGCRDTAVRLRIRTTDAGCDRCHRVDIADGPGDRHGWYDHFAQPCGCPGRRHD